MLLFVPLAVTSNDASMRALKAGMEAGLQRLVYPAAVLVLVHWIFIHNNLVSGARSLHSAGMLLLSQPDIFFPPNPNPKEHEYAFSSQPYPCCRSRFACAAIRARSATGVIKCKAGPVVRLEKRRTN